MNKVDILDDFVFPDTIPSVYDIESTTCIEMVAKLHGAVKNLQETYIELVNNLTEDQESFKEEINQIMHDYIMMIDEKIKMQDLKIEEDISYIRENITEAAQEIINESIANGEISLTSNYEDEVLSLTITNEGGAN